jgi:uncharacterized membrane protein YqaE (UPF0057 family)
MVQRLVFEILRFLITKTSPMNAKPLPLTILALTLAVITTSCNRQNVPEFAAGRFHHKEINNKHSEETILALQQREKIEATSPKKTEGLPTISSVNEDLRSITAPATIETYRHIIKRKVNETPVTANGTVKPEYSKNIFYQFNKPADTKPDAGYRFLCVIISIFIPFLGVGIYEGITVNFWIDLLLTLLFYFPGLIFALIVILSD